jgi:UDP-3-O-[3-hydroxymyristoyl] N-acetylglucosamine deacetylase
MIFQTTLKRSVEIAGIGLHTGCQITMKLRPATSGTGIVFHRIDGPLPVSIEAVSANVVDTRMATVIGRDGVSVSTIEHLMAALSACGIDNLHIDIDGPEVPVMDGSAATFVAHLQQAGIRQLERRRKYLAVRKPITLVEGDKRVSIIPSRFFRVTFDIDFAHASIGQQHRTIKVSEASFRTEIASARTFGFYREVEYLKANGLARGGSLENAVVIGDEGILNPEGLRFNDEFVRHKILDAVGDFSLAGHPILGHVKAVKSGHDLNHKLVEQLLASPDCWQLVEAAEEEALPAIGRGHRAPIAALALSEA